MVFHPAILATSPAELTASLELSAQVYRVKQVHGNVVLTPSEVERAVTNQPDGEPPDEPPPADGLVTENSNQAVWVCSADCTPVLIADAATGQVSAIHAGWRGTAMKIVPQAIARLQRQGSQLQNLRIAMGPAIAGDQYQVSEQVAAQVGATVVSVEPEQVKVSLEALHKLSNPPVMEDPEPGRVRLDVRRINALQLEQLGISPEQVAIAPHCTYQDAENFFSYRRSRQKSSMVGNCQHRSSINKSKLAEIETFNLSQSFELK